MEYLHQLQLLLALQVTELPPPPRNAVAVDGILQEILLLLLLMLLLKQVLLQLRLQLLMLLPLVMMTAVH
jgi:hypothetical protein